MTHLPRPRYRPRIGVEIAYEAALVAAFVAGVRGIAAAESLAACVGWSAVMTVVTIHAILLFHDCMHQSAFGRRRLEGWIARAIGAYYGCPFHFLRAEHLRHHRRAGLVEDDPEALHLHAADAARRPHGPLLARIANSAWDALVYTWLLQLGQFARWIRGRAGRRDRELVRRTAVDVACILALWVPLTAFLVSRGAYARVLVWAFAVPAVVGL